MSRIIGAFIVVGVLVGGLARVGSEEPAKPKDKDAKNESKKDKK